MQVYNSLKSLPQFKKQVCLSIGVFDGVHLGHKKILDTLKAESQGNTYKMVITFSNHPKSILNKNAETKWIIPLAKRLELFQHIGIDFVVVLPFDKKLSETSYIDFFKTLKSFIPITKLIVGADAKFGKNREGTKENIEKLNLFDLVYIEKKIIDSCAISSNSIRSFLKEGNIDLVEKMLGRPYSLLLPGITEQQCSNPQHCISYINAAHICSPPTGSYSVVVRCKGVSIRATIVFPPKGVKRYDLKLIALSPLPISHPLELHFMSLTYNSTYLNTKTLNNKVR